MMTEAFRNLLLTYGGTQITHIGLFDGEAEISGGDPAYARKAVTWDTAASGAIRPVADLTFDIPPGATVDGWRAFSAASGGTNYGGQDLTAEDFAGQGQYKLLAASTGILASDPA
jgi:hypothetical protein